MSDELAHQGPCSTEVCLLSLVDDILPLNKIRSLIRVLLFYAKKLLMIKWMVHYPATVPAWIALINKSLPLIKLTYEGQSCPKRFKSFWTPWLEANPEVKIE